MTYFEQLQKRSFDLVFSFLGLTLLWPLLLVSVPLARASTGGSGIFSQRRIGRNGQSFIVYKLRTMSFSAVDTGSITKENDDRITRLGSWFRKTKIDELPQLWNVFVGDMSLVGPRPDVEGFADNLSGEARSILVLRPGITGPATIKYRNEESLLCQVENMERYNAEVIYPDKIKLNLNYLKNWSLWMDIQLILMTLRFVKPSEELLLKEMNIDFHDRTA